MRRVLAFVSVVCVALACKAKDDAGDPLAGYTICQASCEYEHRCPSPNRPLGDCARQCGDKPQEPPNWRVDFVKAAASCNEKATCEPHAVTQCMADKLAATARGAARQACLERLPEAARGPRNAAAQDCILLAGLTAAADEKLAACYRTSPPNVKCDAPYDWQ